MKFQIESLNNISHKYFFSLNIYNTKEEEKFKHAEEINKYNWYID